MTADIIRTLKWALFSACTVFITGCEQFEVSKKISEKGFIFCGQGTPSSLNPQLVDNDIANEALGPQLFNTLVYLSNSDFNLKPLLASDWSVNKAGTEYLFNLRTDVSFNTTSWFKPTRNMNADDVAFTFNRILNSFHPFHYVGGAQYPWFSAIGFNQTVKQVEAVQPHQVRFTLYRPDNTFLANLSTIYAGIHSAEYGEQLIAIDEKQRLDTHPVGTGPFYLEDYSINDYIRLRRNEEYWRSKPHMEQVVFDISSRGTGTLAKLLRGECDVLYSPRSSQIPIIQASSYLELQAHPSMNLSFIALQTKHPALDDARVRKALNLAVNRDAIIDSVYYGNGSAAYSILPPESWAFYKNAKQVRYDRKYARELLKDAGYAKGLNLTLWVTLEPTAYNPSPRKVAELLQANFADIGVNLNIILDERLSRTNVSSISEADMILTGWNADTNDPDNFFRPLLSCDSEIAGLGETTWCNRDFDALLNLAKESSQQRHRNNLYQQVQSMLNETVPVIPLAHGMQFQAKHKSLTGFNSSSFNTLSFEHVERSE